MKARIIIVDDQGNTLEGDVELAPKGAEKTCTKKVPRTPHTKPRSLDFTLPERAFIKRYARGLSGPKKFVLMLAYLAKGKIGENVQLKDVEDRWNRMTAPLLLSCNFNRCYSNAARENAWVETKKPGVYVLRSAWQDAIKP